LTLKVKVVCSLSANFHQTTDSNIPENITHCCEKLQSSAI
jgi:hypothetical protein